MPSIASRMGDSNNAPLLYFFLLKAKTLKITIFKTVKPNSKRKHTTHQKPNVSEKNIGTPITIKIRIA